MDLPPGFTPPPGEEVVTAGGGSGAGGGAANGVHGARFKDVAHNTHDTLDVHDVTHTTAVVPTATPAARSGSTLSGGHADILEWALPTAGIP